MVVYSVAEYCVNGLNFAPVPSYLNGVAYGSFHAGGRCVALFGYGRVKLFCDVVKNVKLPFSWLNIKLLVSRTLKYILIKNIVANNKL